MNRFAVPCTGCGEPTRDTMCEPCLQESRRGRIQSGNRAPKTSPKARGYDQRWRKLSERARRLQPFCSDCGTTENLQADHSPEAWERHDRGLPLRLVDIDVVCGPCNRERGAARGARRRSKSRTPATVYGGSNER